ncbi:MAG: glycosyltransferase [Tagaea sp.]|nr:glycosyltransferase [Tagaea sp.]
MSISDSDVSTRFAAANARARAGAWGEAIELYRRLMDEAPGFAPARVNLAASLMAVRAFAAAFEAASDAVARFPEFAPAWSVLGEAAMERARPAEAEAAFARAVALAPDASSWAKRALALQAQGRAEAARAAFAQARARAPADPAIASAALFCAHYDPVGAPDDALAQAQSWPNPAPGAARPAPADPDPERRLRVAYVSPDFANHSCSYFLAPLLAAHDRAKVELFAYSDVATPDGVTQAFQGLDLVWRDMTGRDDDAFAAQARADGIDVLVDCAGHTTGNRLTAFARRAAPVQVTWLGYPGTTGLDVFDARPVDAETDPPDAVASEPLIRVKDGFLAYLPPPYAPEPGPPPFARNGFVTFGSFNNLPKLNPRTLALWARAVAAVPDARLLIKARGLDEAPTAKRVRAALAAAGLPAERVDLRGFVDGVAAHIAVYGEVDIALDPTPYNGTTTTCEALWMGVPVLTLAGDRHASRVGVSLLTRVGLDDLIAATPEDFVARAAALAADPAKLGELRAGLRARLAASALCDGHRLARAFETIYRELWRRVVPGRPMV